MTAKVQCTCRKCQYQWQSRVAKPKECPACKSRAWDEGATKS